MTTSRQRWLLTTRHREPDRVPVDVGGGVSGILEGAPYGYSAVCRHLDIDDPDLSSFDPSWGFVMQPDERLLQRLGSDVRHVCAGVPEMQAAGDGLHRDVYGILIDSTGAQVGLAHGREPLRDCREVAELDAYPYWPDPDDPLWTEGKRDEARRLRESTQCAVMADPGWFSSVWLTFYHLVGFDRWLLMMGREKRLYRALADRILGLNIEITRRYLREVGPYIDCVYGGESVGHQQGPFMSVRTYRELIKPWNAAWVEMVRQTVPHANVMIHSDGAVFDLIPEFIDSGFDVINPLQPGAAGMEPERVKQAYGDQVCLHGGFDTQGLLPRGTPSQIREEAKRLMDILAPGGGYVFAAAHNIMPDVPPQNVEALYEAVAEFGVYR